MDPDSGWEGLTAALPATSGTKKTPPRFLKARFCQLAVIIHRYPPSVKPSRDDMRKGQELSILPIPRSMQEVPCFRGHLTLLHGVCQENKCNSSLRGTQLAERVLSQCVMYLQHAP